MMSSNLIVTTGPELLKELGARGANYVVNALSQPNPLSYSGPGEVDDRFLSPSQRFLKSGLNVNALRTNATLDYDEWKQIDASVTQVAQPILVCAGDLMTGGLLHPMNSLGMMISQYSRVSDMNDASVSMSVATAADRDRVSFDQVMVPIPVICKEFQLDIRQLQAHRNGHEGLDVTSARAAGRSVSRAMESMVISGSSVVVSGNAIYGYLTHPDINPITTSKDWGTVANIYDSVLEMIAALVADLHYGPYMLYVNPAQYVQALEVTSSATPNKTALDLVKALPQIIDVKMAEKVPAGTGIMVEMNMDTVDLAMTQNITTIQWEERGGWVNNFMVISVMAPRIKSDYDEHCGVCTHTNI